MVGTADDEEPRLAVDLGAVGVVERRVGGRVVGARCEAHGTIDHEMLRPGEEGNDGGQPLADLGQWSSDAAGGAVVEDGIGGEDRFELFPPAGIDHGRIPHEKVVDLQAVGQEAQVVRHAPEGTADQLRAPRPHCVACSPRVGSWHETSSRGTAGRNRSAWATRSGLHLSSSAGRPVRVEVARVGARREVVFRRRRGRCRRARDAARCGLEGVRVAGRARPWTSSRRWRSGYYEVVMEIDVGEKVRRDYAFFVVRPSPGTRIVLALATNTWHAYNDFGGPNLYTGGTHVAMQRPMAAGYLYKPPGKGRRVTGTGRARSAECRARRLHPDQPPLGLRRVGRLARLGAAVHPVGRTRGLRDRRVHQCRSGGAPRGAGGRQPVPLRRARRVLVTRHARHGRGVRRAAAAMRPSSRATRRCGRCASRATITTSWSATRASSRATR